MTMQEDYAKESARKREALRAIAEGLARELGENWTAPPYEDGGDWRARVVHVDGATLFISNTWASKGRIHIGGSFPQGYGPRGEKHSITVAESRTPQAIAREVSRRLLPDYLAAYAKATEQKTKDENARSSAETLALSLSLVLGDDNFRRRNFREGTPPSTFTVYGNDGVTAELSSYGDPRFKVTVPKARALDVAKAIVKCLA